MVKFIRNKIEKRIRVPTRTKIIFTRKMFGEVFVFNLILKVLKDNIFLSFLIYMLFMLLDRLVIGITKILVTGTIERQNIC